MSAETSTKLDTLYTYLKHMPPLAPEKTRKSYNLENFAPSQDDVTELGRESAINRRLEITFGTRAYGPVALTDRGKGLVKVVSILEDEIGKCDGGSVVLEKWVDDLVEAAKVVYEEASVALPEVTERPVIPEGDEDPEVKILDGPPQPPAKEKKKEKATASVDVHRESKTLASFEDPLYDDIFEDRKPARRAGSQTLPLLYDISRKYRVSGGKERIRCAASSACKMTWAAPRDRARILTHAVECTYLRDEWCVEAGTTLADMPMNATKRRATSPPAASVPSSSLSLPSSALSKRQKRENTPVHPVLQTMFTKSKKESHAHTTKCLVVFLCCNLAPPEIVDSDEFREFIDSLGTDYQSPSASTIRKRLIPIEAARVTRAADEYLMTCRNLTISFDGGKIRRKVGFYSVHVITSQGRSYLMALDDASRVRHTAEYIAELLEKIMRRIGLFRFIGVVSDNTGNTRKARRLIHKRHAQVINIQDCCHEISLCIKEISNLEVFKEALDSVRAVLKFMNQSGLAAAPFEDARKAKGIDRGLESIGQTRFANLTWSADSVRRCLPAFRIMMKDWSSQIDIPGDRNALFEEGFESVAFEAELLRFVSVSKPFAKSIKCLEASTSDLSHVCLFWFAILVTLAQLFGAGRRSGISDELQTTITEIVERRFRNMILKAQYNIYLVAFFCDPRNRDAPIWGNIDPKAADISLSSFKAAQIGATTDAAPSSASSKLKRLVYKGLFDVLKDMFGQEPTRETTLERIPELANIPPARAGEMLYEEFIDYCQPREPFTLPFRASDTPLVWWAEVAASFKKTKKVSVLATVCTKIFSIRPNSMGDERTASQVTHVNAPRRANLKLAGIRQMIQIKQFHRHDPKKEAARVVPTVRWRDMSDVVRQPEGSLLRLAKPVGDLSERAPASEATSKALDDEITHMEWPDSDSDDGDYIPSEVEDDSDDEPESVHADNATGEQDSIEDEALDLLDVGKGGLYLLAPMLQDLLADTAAETSAVQEVEKSASSSKRPQALQWSATGSTKMSMKGLKF